MLEELKNKTFANEAEEAAWWKSTKTNLPKSLRSRPRKAGLE